MNYSTALAVLATSAVGPFAAKWHEGVTPIWQQIEALVGSFFGRGAVARQRAGV
jgi:hypothetical protein